MSHEAAPEQRTIDWAKIIEIALTVPGNVGNTYNRFYEYSFLNQMYLLMQGVHEPVATWARWKAIGGCMITLAKVSSTTPNGSLPAAPTLLKPLAKQRSIWS